MQIKTQLNMAGLNGLSANAEKIAEDVLDYSAKLVQKHWQEYIVQKGVIDTGAYFNSIRVRAKTQPLEREITDGVEYGIHQEYGTSRFGARPCATPAVEDVRPVFFKAMALVPGLAAKKGRR